LSDIPREAIKQADNGKKYLSIVVCKKKEADQFGNTHYIALSQSKEEREAKAARVYIGDGKEYILKAVAPTVEDVENLPSASDDDLPF